MEDQEIVRLYWDRDERAIEESEKKYGGLCRGVALRVLESIEDSEECVSDTWLHSWNAIPPRRPALLGAFLARITRNLARVLNAFLRSLPEGDRALFLRRYWAVETLESLAKREGMSVSALHRRLGKLRKALADHLKKEGIEP